MQIHIITLVASIICGWALGARPPLRMATSVPGEEFRIKKSLYLTQLFGGSNAGVAKLGQRRKVEGLVLSGPRVQIPSPAPFFTTWHSYQHG